MLAVAAHDDEGLRAGRREEFRVGGFLPAVVVVLEDRHLPGDVGDIGLLIALVGGEVADVAAAEVAAVVIGEVAVADKDAAAVHVLVEEGRVPGVHGFAAGAPAGPYPGVAAEIPYFELPLVGLRIVFQDELAVAADVQLLADRPLRLLVVEELEVFRHDVAGLHHLLPAREIVVGIVPVDVLVYFHFVADEEDPGAAETVLARLQGAFRAHVVGMEMGQHRVVEVARRGGEVIDVPDDIVPGTDIPVRDGMVPVRRTVGRADVAGIDHPGRPVGQDEEGGVALAGADGVDVHHAFLPGGKVFRAAGSLGDLIGLEGIRLLPGQGQDAVISAGLHVVEPLVVHRDRDGIADVEQLGVEDIGDGEDVPGRAVVRLLPIGAVGVEDGMRPLFIHGTPGVHDHFAEFKGVLDDLAGPFGKDLLHRGDVVHDVVFRPLLCAVEHRVADAVHGNRILRAIAAGHDGEVFHLLFDQFFPRVAAEPVRLAVEQLRECGAEAEGDDDHRLVRLAGEQFAVFRDRLGVFPFVVAAPPPRRVVFQHDRCRVIAVLSVEDRRRAFGDRDFRIAVIRVQDIDEIGGGQALLVVRDHHQVQLAVLHPLVGEGKGEGVVDVVAHVRFDDQGLSLEVVRRLGQGGPDRCEEEGGGTDDCRDTHGSRGFYVFVFQFVPLR